MANRISGEVAVIVVTHNALASLKQCLASIQHNTRVIHRLIVVDNGSKDGTGRFLCRYVGKRNNAHVIGFSRNIGKAAALNAAVRQFPSAWYALLDDDTEVPEAWLARLLKAAAYVHPKPDIVGCRTVYPDGRICGAEMFSWRAAHGREEKDLGQRSYTRLCDGVTGTCMLVRGKLFGAIRFKEALHQQYEDGDFCLQARRRGARILYCGSIAVRHKRLFRTNDAELSRNYALMTRKWGNPIFSDSFALDQAYALAWKCLRARQWRDLLHACRWLETLDPAPTYVYWWRAISLSRLGRHREALLSQERALNIDYLPRLLRIRLELAREQEIQALGKGAPTTL